MRFNILFIPIMGLLGLSMTGCVKSKGLLPHQQWQCTQQQTDSWRYKLNVVERDETEMAKDCFSISKGEIDDAIRQNLDDIGNCLKQTIARCPGQKRISVSMVINKEGTVSRSTIVKGSHYDTALMHCVSAKTTNWVFPKPKYSNHYAFVYPFLME